MTMTTTATPKPATISDSKFDELKKKLRELFELDKSDLDFGIYRIMAAKNAEVTAFLDRQLKDVVRQTLTEHGTQAADRLQDEIAKARAAAQAAGFDPDQSPKVKELQARITAATGGSIAELEADIYNHLLAFFGRYYDEGDFISKRRYKGDTYAIPYSGEEVALHWANKDQYYIKSGEWHKDYRFKLPSGSRGNSGGTSGDVRFKLVDATAETGNNKEADNAKRRYVLVDQDPIEVVGDELILRFEFRVPTESQKQRAGDDAVAIFGGKYAGSMKGDEREQFCADAEKRALAALTALTSRDRQVADWLAALQTPSPTDSKPLRTILGRHLDLFTARNTFDYFIHKDLGGFLRRELDFYIKNEIVRLDDLESLDEGHLARVQGKIKALRRVAGRVIDFLAAVENFQKKLWLKKKFVLQTHWLVTIDRIPPALRDFVVANQEQWAEWERLGFKLEAQEGQLQQGPAWGTREYLDANDKLVLDTHLFDDDFKPELLACDGAMASTTSLDAATTGILIHSENFQALNLMRERFKGRVRCVYIDPPYNTGEDDFIYKDGYRASSWHSLINDRLLIGRVLSDTLGTLTASIDDAEVDSLSEQLRTSFGAELAKLVWDRNRKNDPRYFSVGHEYMLVHAKDINALKAAEIRFREPKEGVGDARRLFEKLKKQYGSDYEQIREKWLTWFDNIPVADPRRRMLRYNQINERGPFRDDGNINWPGGGGPRYEIIHPITGKPVKVPISGWRYPTTERFWEEVSSGRIVFGPDETTVPGVASYLFEGDDQVMPSVFYSYAQTAMVEFEALFSSRPFENPKNWRDIQRIVNYLGERGSTVLDYFAGSGTTGHAVVNLNREDGGDRKFILVEMGNHFHTVLKPRIAKVLYSPDWKDGKAQVHGKGVSALVKYFALESYEDALNNLPAPTGDLLAQADPATRESLLTYALDLELGPQLLNLEAFKDPWGYTIHAQRPGSDEITRQSVDLVETFNYLLGLKVHAYGPIERYACEFKRSKHADGMGRLVVDGRLRKDADGPFVFHRVEGELNDDNGTRVLVVWRKLTGDAEQDAAALDAWMARHAESTRERSEHRDYHRIYINGPVTLAQPTAGDRLVLPIEETFKNRMFEDTEGA